MKFLRFIYSVFITLILSLSSLAFAGAGGHGIDELDSYQPDDFRWFSGDHVVTYCYVRSNNFGASDDQIQSALLYSFRLWKNYLKEKVGDAPTIFAGPNWPTFESQFVKKCRGTEDIVFHFGDTNPQIEKAKKGHLNPIAISKRTSWNAETNIGKGIVWLAGKPEAPDFITWGQNNHLEGALLHELGHVLGCGHVDHTIMSAYIYDAMRNAHFLS